MAFKLVKQLKTFRDNNDLDSVYRILICNISESKKQNHVWFVKNLRNHEFLCHISNRPFFLLCAALIYVNTH